MGMHWMRTRRLNQLQLLIIIIFIQEPKLHCNATNNGNLEWQIDDAEHIHTRFRCLHIVDSRGMHFDLNLCTSVICIRSSRLHYALYGIKCMRSNQYERQENIFWLDRIMIDGTESNKYGTVNVFIRILLWLLLIRELMYTDAKC